MRNDHLDNLRAYAVLLVLAYHAVPSAFPGGFLGVDVFFVLSGFFIASAVGSGQHFSPWPYLVRRVQRLLPVLLLVLGVTLVAGARLLLPGEYASLAFEALKAMSFVGNLAPAQSDYFGPGTSELPMAHLWSLGVEVQIYIGAAFALPLLPRRLSVPVVYVTIAMLSLGCLWWLSLETTSAFFHPASRAWEFALGALVAFLPQVPQISRLLAVAFLVLFCLVPFWTFGPHPGLGTLPAILGAVAFIQWARWAGPYVGPAIFPLLGRSSYAIYLWHWPMLTLWKLHHLGEVSSSGALLVISLSVFLGLLTYQLFERYAIQSTRIRTTLTGCGIAMFLMLTAVFSIGESQGLPQRLPENVRTILATTRVSHPDLLRCHSIFPENLILAADGCVHNASGQERPRVAVWGDSHAAALAGGLIRAGLSFRELSYSGCPPLPGLYIDARGVACGQFAEEAYQLILSDPDIETVIMVARWPLYFDGPFDSRHGGREAAKPFRMRHLSSAAITDTATLSAVLSGTVEQLAQSGKRVLLLAPTPAFGWDIRSVNARLSWQDRDMDLTLEASTHLAYQRQSQAALRRAAVTGRAEIIDPSSLFCDAERCRASDSTGALLLHDQDHLSALGADRLAELVIEHLYKATPRATPLVNAGD